MRTPMSDPLHTRFLPSVYQLIHASAEGLGAVRRIADRVRVAARWGKYASHNYIHPSARCTLICGAQLGKGVRLEADVELRVGTSVLGDGDLGAIRLENDVCIATGATLVACGAPISIGERTLIGVRCHLGAFGRGIRIGKDVLIAPHCSMVDTQHVYADPAVPIRAQGFTSAGIAIEDDVWLGTGVIVMDGVSIGRGAVVGAGAVVTQDLPAYAVAVGSPARVIKWRRDPLLGVRGPVALAAGSLSHGVAQCVDRMSNER
jgi:acetyltransferase-like isoleucine patch superfamily enzyme